MIGLRGTSTALSAVFACVVIGCGEGEQLPQARDVAVSVNALAPVNSLPPPQTTNEDSQLTFSVNGGNTITVDDGDNATSTVQITVTNGVFAVGPEVNGITVTGNGTASVILSGPIRLYEDEDEEELTGGINKALDGARYTPATNFNGAATLQMNSSDTNGEVGFDILSITVTSFNDSPVNNVPAGIQAATRRTCRKRSRSRSTMWTSAPPDGGSLSSTTHLDHAAGLSASALPRRRYGGRALRLQRTSPTSMPRSRLTGAVPNYIARAPW